MYELSRWIWEHRNQPVTWAMAMSFMWLVLDKFGRKLITNQLKRLFNAKDKSEFSAYVENQKRIESKVDLILTHLGVSECVERKDLSQSLAKPLSKSSTKGKSFVLTVGAYIRKVSTIYSRRNKMKSYLSKLSSTKLQALIVATFMNVALLVGYVLDVQDIQSKVDAWMPMANMLVQMILTIAYQWARASVDKAELVAKAPVDPGVSDVEKSYHGG